MDVSIFTSGLWLTSWTFRCFSNSIPAITTSLDHYISLASNVCCPGWPHKFFGFASWTRQLCQCLSCFQSLVSFKKCYDNCRFDIGRSRAGPTKYEECLHLSDWVTHLHSAVPTKTHSYATLSHELKSLKHKRHKVLVIKKSAYI